MRVAYQNADIFISTGGKAFEADQEVLLFIHGSGQSHLTFLQQGRFFANRGWSVLNPDMPAHGHSSGTPLQTIEEMADWYAGLLKEMGVSAVRIIGHSQGCLTGLEMAKKYPNLVKKLCLIAGAMAIPVNEALLDMAAHKPQAAYQAMINWAHGNDSHLYDHSWPGQTHIEFGHAVMSANHEQALLADLSACNEYQGGKEAASAVQCKALAILATGDKMTPLKFGMKMVEMIPNCTHHIVEKAGHFLPSERPFDINKTLRAFLAQ